MLPVLFPGAGKCFNRSGITFNTFYWTNQIQHADRTDHGVVHDRASLLQVSGGQEMVRVVERVREERRSELAVFSWKDR